MTGGAGHRGPDFLIVGSPRSGTTLAQRLACELPGVTMPPETHFFDIFVRQLLRRGGPPFDRIRLEKEIAEWSQLDQVRGVELDVPAVAARLGGECHSLLDLFDAIVRQLAPAGDVYGEKTPNHLFWWRPIVRAIPSVRIVATVRDPRAVVASNLAAPWARDIVHPRWGADAYVAIAERCRRELEEVVALAQVLGSRCLVLRYEDMVIDPWAARAAMGDLLGVPLPDVSPQETLHAPLQRAQRSIVLPWETWKSEALESVRTDRVTTWRGALGARRGRVVSGVCKDVMRHFGYLTSRVESVRGVASALGLGPMTQRRRWALRRGLRSDMDWINEVVL